MKQLLFFIFISLNFLSCSQNLNGKMLNDLSAKGIITEDGKELSIPDYTNGETAIFYLVRHAEKEAGKNPGLTEAGVKRAEKLGEMMKEIQLSSIFSTNYKRTIYTVSPTSEVLDKKVEKYDAKKQSAFLKPLLSRKGERFLIVGHSNTIPDLLNLFQSKKVYDDIDEKIYDNFYIVLYKSESDCKIIELKY